jgi:hypothetical protein
MPKNTFGPKNPKIRHVTLRPSINSKEGKSIPNMESYDSLQPGLSKYIKINGLTNSKQDQKCHILNY